METDSTVGNGRPGFVPRPACATVDQRTLGRDVPSHVTNTWRNRLIGDAGLLPEQRTTWTWHREAWYNPTTNLEPAGLLGPVMLRTARGEKME